MTPIDGGFTRSHEVDRVRWVPASEVGRVLTCERDRGVGV